MAARRYLPVLHFYVKSALGKFRGTLAAAEFNRVWNDLSVLGKEE